MLDQSIKESLLQYAGGDRERVGFILVDGSIIEVENSHVDPIRNFSVAPKTILNLEDQIAATWHTHPFTTSNLSGEDLECFQNWPEFLHVIIGKDRDISVFEVKEGCVIQC